VPGGPVGQASADVKQEVPQDLATTRGVCDLGMELNPVQTAGAVLEGGDRAVRAGCREHEPLRQLRHVIPVTHPDRRLLAGDEASEEAARVAHLHIRPSVLPAPRFLHLASARERDEIHPVAHTENRRSDMSHLRVQQRRPVVVHRVGTAGKDDSSGVLLPNPRDRGGGWVDRASRIRRAMSWVYWEP
jgi:hypothetical protein